jgi:molybdopterin synthase catalytic subunit
VTVTVLFFAIARDRAGCGEAILALADGSTVRDAQTQIIRDFPAVESILPYVRYAVDEAFVSDLDAPLRPGATVAIIPPVAGG